MSIWNRIAEKPSFPPLPGDFSTDTVVIGGGMAGILTAYFLQKQGVDAVVLEAETVGSGQTQNTTAKITSQHGLIYHKLIETLGDEAARQYADVQQAAIAEYRRIIEEEGIDCSFTPCPAFLYSLTEEEPLHEEADAARSLGIDACFTTETELPFPVQGAVRFEGQARFHPLSFLYAVAQKVPVYEHTKVRTVESGVVVTDRGVVTARHVMFATHYPFLNAPGYYFMRMHQERSYVIALENVPPPQGMYLGIDEENGWSVREAEGLVLFGGGKHRTGENRKGGQYQKLMDAAGSFWPQSRVVDQWSAQDCMTLDGIPYIGQFSASTPDWYIATGFQKWGMTSSMASAMILSDLIRERGNPYAEVFSPLRFTPGASAKNFLNEGMHAVRDLSRRVLAPPRAEVEALPKGHGGVVEYDGEKMGVYRDDAGEVYAVSIQCPHLGCQLEWNPDEKSWDCPCHGSRFDYHGNLIDNPAQEDLLRDGASPSRSTDPNFAINKEASET